MFESVLVCRIDLVVTVDSGRDRLGLGSENPKEVSEIYVCTVKDVLVTYTYFYLTLGV